MSKKIVSLRGTSGSGKSVTVQDLVSSLIGTGGRVFIIDVGRSYKKLCNELNGQFIEFTYHSKLCLNPFSHIDEAKEDEVNDFASKVEV